MASPLITTLLSAAYFTEAHVLIRRIRHVLQTSYTQLFTQGSGTILRALHHLPTAEITPASLTPEDSDHARAMHRDERNRSVRVHNTYKSSSTGVVS